MSNYFYTTNGDYTTDGNYTTKCIHTRNNIYTIPNKNIETFENSSSKKTIEDIEKVVNEISTTELIVQAQETHTLVIKAIEAQKLVTQAIQELHQAEMLRTKTIQTYNIEKAKQVQQAQQVVEVEELFEEIGNTTKTIEKILTQVITTQLTASSLVFAIKTMQTIQTQQLKQTQQSIQIEQFVQSGVTILKNCILIRDVSKKSKTSDHILFYNKMQQNPESIKNQNVLATQAIELQKNLEKLSEITQLQISQAKEKHIQVQAQAMKETQTQAMKEAETLTRAKVLIETQTPELTPVLNGNFELLIKLQKAHRLAIEALQMQILATYATKVAHAAQLLIEPLLKKEKNIAEMTTDIFFEVLIQSRGLIEILPTTQKKAFITQQKATQIAQLQSEQSSQLKHSKEALQAFQTSQEALSKARITNDTSTKTRYYSHVITLTDETLRIQLLQKAFSEQIQQAHASESMLAIVVHVTRELVQGTKEVIEKITQEAQKQEAQKQEAQKQAVQEAQKQAVQEAQIACTKQVQSIKTEVTQSAQAAQKQAVQEAQKQAVQEAQIACTKQVQAIQTEAKQAVQEAQIACAKQVKAIQTELSSSKIQLLYIIIGCIVFILCCIIIYWKWRKVLLLSPQIVKNEIK